MDWEAWLHAPGLPPVTPELDDTWARACEALLQRWRAAVSAQAYGDFRADDVQSLTSPQVQHAGAR